MLFLLSYSSLIHASLNHETHDFSFEYGLGYQTLRAEQKSNGSTGKFTTQLRPYWSGGYTLRVTQDWGVRLFGGVNTIHFNEPDNGSIEKNGDKYLSNYGLEIIHKTSPLVKVGYFVMNQQRPLYYTDSPGVFNITVEDFLQAGMHFAIGQRRRIGLLWGAGLKIFTLYPARGGDVVTETGAGGEAYARLGWVDPFGTLYQIKGIYQAASAPNAEVNFTNELLS